MWLVIPFLLTLAEVPPGAQEHTEEEAPLTTHPTWPCYFILTRTSPHHAIILPRWEWKPLALQIQDALCRVWGRLFGTRVGPLQRGAQSFVPKLEPNDRPSSEEMTLALTLVPELLQGPLV